MRPLTSTQQAIVQQSILSYATHWQVRVDREGDGNWVNLHDFLGYDLIASLSLGESVDNNVMELDLKLVSQIGEIRLSPLVSGGIANIDSTGALSVLLEPGNAIEVRAAVSVAGVTPEDNEYFWLLDGLIDKVVTSPNQITVKCRDRSSVLLSDYVEEITRYGSSGGTASETVIDSIVADHGSLPFVLDAPVLSSFSLLEYAQRKEPVMSAIRKIAQQIGWDIRYRANSSLSVSGDVSETFGGWQAVGLGTLLSEQYQTTVNITPAGSGDRVVLLAFATQDIGSPTFPRVDRVRLGGQDLNLLTEVTYQESFGGWLSVYWARESELTLDNNPILVVDLDFDSGTIIDTFCQLLVLENGSTITDFSTDSGSAGTPRSIGALSHESGDLVFAVGVESPALSSSNPSGLVEDGTLTLRGGNVISASPDTSTVTATGASALIAGVVRSQPAGTRSESFTLKYYEPERTKTTPDDTLPPDLVLDYSGLSVDNYTVRNKIRVVFVDQATGQRTEVIREDAASQARYGVRFMEVVEGSSSNIDTLVEATRMADAILEDLKEPTVKMSATLPFRPWIELGDLLRLEANGEQWSIDLDLAVQSYTHSLGANGSVVTRVTLEGKPSSGWKRWFELEARPGVGNDTRTEQPDTPTGVVATSSLGGIQVEFDQPTDIGYAGTEVHVSDQAGFTPTDATLRGFTRTNQFNIGGLIVGTTYYVVLLHVDTQGNKSAPTVQVITASEYVGPVHRNPETAFYDSVNENFNFSVFSKGTDDYPDFWGFDGFDKTFGLAASSGPWSSSGDDTWYFDTSTARLGRYAVKYSGVPSAFPGTPQDIFSDLAPVEGGQFYAIRYSLQVDGDAGPLPFAFFYDRNRNLLGSGLNRSYFTFGDFTFYGNTPASAASPTPGTYFSFEGYLFSPDDAAFMQLGIEPKTGATLGGEISSFSIDQMRVFRSLARFVGRSSAVSGNQVIPDQTWTRIDHDLIATEDSASGFTNAAAGPEYEAQIEGFYSLSARAKVVIPSGQIGIRIVDDSGTVLCEGFSPAGEDQAQCSGMAFLSEGDILHLEFFAEDGGVDNLVDLEEFSTEWQINQYGEIR